MKGRWGNVAHFWQRRLWADKRPSITRQWQWVARDRRARRVPINCRWRIRLCPRLVQGGVGPAREHTKVRRRREIGHLGEGRVLGERAGRSWKRIYMKRASDCTDGSGTHWKGLRELCTLMDLSPPDVEASMGRWVVRFGGCRPAEARVESHSEAR
jgi:hypothetical protein